MSVDTDVEGVLKRYPEIGDRHKKVLSNLPEGSIEPPKKVLSKRFYRTLEGLQNHRQGSIEPFTSNPPILGYPF